MVGAVRHENACMAGLDSCIYSHVSVACKFLSSSEGMIMSCFKDGLVLCVCFIAWMGINRGGAHKPCYYVSPGFPFFLI